MIWFISPHFDDAVLSCGEQIQREHSPTVVTVMSGAPKHDLVTDYDVRSGWRNSTDARIGRHAENVRACTLLGAMVSDLGLMDAQYGEEPRLATLSDTWVMTFEEGDTVYAPLGLGHRDHLAVSNTVLDACAGLPVTLWLYEDLPFRVLQPMAAQSRVRDLVNAGWSLELEARQRGDVDSKHLAIWCYRSQMWALDWRAALVPERYWRATHA